MTSIITNILLAVMLILDLGTFVIYRKNRIPSKGAILADKIKQTQTVICDNEVEVEVSWLLLRQNEERRDAAIALLEKTEKEMIEAKANSKSKEDWEKVEQLNKKCVELGRTTKKDKTTGKPIYEGRISQLDAEVQGYRSKIEQSVFKREFGKMQLIGLRAMKKQGWAKDFQKFERENLKDLLYFKDWKDEK